MCVSISWLPLSENWLFLSFCSFFLTQRHDFWFLLRPVDFMITSNLFLFCSFICIWISLRDVIFHPLELFYSVPLRDYVFGHKWFASLRNDFLTFTLIQGNKVNWVQFLLQFKEFELYWGAVFKICSHIFMISEVKLEWLWSRRNRKWSEKASCFAARIFALILK